MNIVKKLYRRIRGARRYRNVTPRQFADLVHTILLNMQRYGMYRFDEVVASGTEVTCYAKKEPFVGSKLVLKIADLKLYYGAERIGFIHDEIDSQLGFGV